MITVTSSGGTGPVTGANRSRARRVAPASQGRAWAAASSRRRSSTAARSSGPSGPLRESGTQVGAVAERLQGGVVMRAVADGDGLADEPVELGGDEVDVVEADAGLAD